MSIDLCLHLHRSSRDYPQVLELPILVSNAEQLASIRRQDLLLFNEQIKQFVKKIRVMESIVFKSNVTTFETVEMNSLNNQTLRQTNVSHQ